MNAYKRFKRATAGRSPDDRRVLRARFRALKSRFGPFADVYVYDLARDAVELRLVFERATEELARLTALRRRNDRHRQLIERARRRQGVSWQTYLTAEQRLEETASGRHRDASKLFGSGAA